MATLNIVMVEPEIPQNTGNVARTCSATGARLHLVGPMGFTIDDKKLKRAGLDYWHLLDISYYDSLNDFFAKNEIPEENLFFFSTKSPRFLPGQLLSVLWQGNKRLAGGFTPRPSSSGSANSHDQRSKKFESLQCRCHRCLRGAAPVELPHSPIRRTSARLRLGFVKFHKTRLCFSILIVSFPLNWCDLWYIMKVNNFVKIFIKEVFL